MDIHSSKIPDYVHDAVVFSLRTTSGGPFREISLHELSVLVEAEQVRAVVRGTRIKTLYLTVPPDVAGRTMGETKRKVKDSLHSDASTTIQRSDDSLPNYHKRHHLAHCFAWPTRRHVSI
jgi:hypothetical protein